MNRASLFRSIGVCSFAAVLLYTVPKYPGMLVRTESDIAGHKMTTTLVSVQETDVPDSDFAIPSDYPVQEMKMPAIPAKPTDG